MFRTQQQQPARDSDPQQQRAGGTDFQSRGQAQGQDQGNQGQVRQGSGENGGEQQVVVDRHRREDVLRLGHEGEPVPNLLVQRHRHLVLAVTEASWTNWSAKPSERRWTT